MSDLYLYTIKLLRFVLCGDRPELVSDIDFEKLFLFSQYHSIENMVYAGLVELNIDVPENIMSKFKEVYNGAIVYDTMQDVALAELESKFEEDSIDYMPLKGSVIKKYYPMPDYRKSGDIDILIKPEDEKRVIEIMEELGYDSVEDFEAHDIHRTYQKLPYVAIEIHRKLVRPNNRAYDLCKDVWMYAHPCADKKNCFSMNPEFLYVYLIAHLAKHIYSGGVGIRLLTDIWIMRKQFELDSKIVDEYLSRANLVKINDIIVGLVEHLFEDKPSADKSVLILKQIVFMSGDFGTSQTKSIIIGNESIIKKFNRFMLMLFPPVGALLVKYPILKKGKYYLPLVWIYRWFRLIFSERKGVSEKIKNNFDNTNKNREFDDIMDAVRDK